jgi:hypothetical protein
MSTGTTRYSRYHIIRALRRHANEDGTLTHDQYNARRRPNEPSGARVCQRYGWAFALEMAGLDGGKQFPRHRADRWTEEECIDAVQQCYQDLAAEIPLDTGRLTYHQYEVWQSERAGARAPGLTHRGEAPSGTTLRNRFGTWSEICEAAGLPVLGEWGGERAEVIR